MTFLNPLGLLALLSVPLIIFFHYFRQQRKNKKIGGIHLWDFARVESPTGAKYDRLVNNLPLLFQILAAIFLSLLLAGLHIPLRSDKQTLMLIVDDSVSMQASDGKTTAFDRFVKILDDKTQSSDLITVVSSGVSPKVLVGPNDSRQNALKILNSYKPGSIVSNFNEAMNLAEKLSENNNMIYYFTDNPSGEKDNLAAKNTLGVGKPLNNIAISYGERYSVEENQDEIFLTLRSFSKEAEKFSVLIGVAAANLGREDVTLNPSQSLNLRFKIPKDTPPVDVNLTVRDALEIDNHIRLLPPVSRNVHVFVDNFEGFSQNFVKAVKSVDKTVISSSPDDAHLLLLKASNKSSRTDAVKYYFNDSVSTSTGMTIPGNLLTKGIDSAITEKVPLEGVLWNVPNPGFNLQSALSADLSYTSIPLIYAVRNSREKSVREVNLNFEKSNIMRTPAWPTLIQAMIEDCRTNLPGLSRSNYYVGEDVVLNLKSDEGSTFFLQADGNSEPFAQYENSPPEVIKNLPAGTYSFVQKTNSGNSVLASFQMNLFSESESNILSASSTPENLISLEAGSQNILSDNPWVFYSLIFLAVASILLAWRYHDIGL